MPGSLLTPVLKEAVQTRRVTCGVMECAKLLLRNHDNVMMCMLPETSGQHDVTVDIEHTLIEAFCLENNIQVIKVNNTDRLHSILCGTEPSGITADDVMSCILVEYPEVKTNPQPLLPLENSCTYRARSGSFYEVSREVPP